VTSGIGSSRAGGWNGGGNVWIEVISASITLYNCGRGGATDVRIGDNTLFHRLIFAGRRGGGDYYNCARLYNFH
jgi:hypothetical protein